MIPVGLGLSYRQYQKMISYDTANEM
jgi:hypothetical protein